MTKMKELKMKEALLQEKLKTEKNPSQIKKIKKEIEDTVLTFIGLLIKQETTKLRKRIEERNKKNDIRWLVTRDKRK